MSYESGPSLQAWERRHEELKNDLINRCVRLTDNRPPTPKDHPNLTRIYDGVSAIMAHMHERPKPDLPGPKARPTCGKCGGTGRYLASYPTRGGMASFKCECVKEAP